MPILDGISASAKIREFERARGLPKKPIAVITGNSSEHTRKLAVQAGCNEFLVKPLGRVDLAITLMRLMSRTVKILVIDDDELCLSVNCRMITSQGIKTVSTKNPLEGMALVKQHWD